MARKEGFLFEINHILGLEHPLWDHCSGRPERYDQNYHKSERNVRIFRTIPNTKFIGLNLAKRSVNMI